MSRRLKFDRINLMGLPAPEGMTQAAAYAGGITEVKFLPGTMDEVLITRKSGPVYHFKLNGDTATLVSTLSLGGGQVNNRQDCGLISLTPDPDFATNRFVYFGHCTGGAGRATKISRATLNEGQLTNRVDIFNVQAPGGGNSWHSVGSIGFDKDKNLWMLQGEFNTGDGSLAQDVASNLGKLHRIVPSRDPMMGGSMPAPGNPDGRSYVARGLRSPWRGAYHPGTGWYLVAEVGPDGAAWEEINVVTEMGANLGWPNGTCNAGSLLCWRTGLNTMKIMDTDNLQDDNATRPGRSAWVAPPYGDCGNDRYDGALTGVVLSGDFFKGWVIGMTLDAAGTKTRDSNLVESTFTMISSITQGPDGFFYVTKFGNYHQGAQTDTTQGLYRVTLVP